MTCIQFVKQYNSITVQLYYMSSHVLVLQFCFSGFCKNLLAWIVCLTFSAMWSGWAWVMDGAVYLSHPVPSGTVHPMHPLSDDRESASNLSYFLRFHLPSSLVALWNRLAAALSLMKFAPQIFLAARCRHVVYIVQSMSPSCVNFQWLSTVSGYKQGYKIISKLASPPCDGLRSSWTSGKSLCGWRVKSIFLNNWVLVLVGILVLVIYDTKYFMWIVFSVDPYRIHDQ